VKIKYIILGKNGFVAKKLFNELNKRKKNVLTISWENLKNNSLEKILLEKKTKESDLSSFQEKFVFLDCLIGNSDVAYELKLHSRLIIESRVIQKKSIFFYFSTFESNLSAQTSYRKMKYIVENFLISKNSKVIRIGQLIQFENNLNFQNNFFLSDIKRNPILIPCTYIEKLVEDLLTGKFDQPINKCYSFYSKMYMTFKKNSIIQFSEFGNQRFALPIPLHLIASTSYAFSYIFKIIKNNKLKNFFQKFYSVYEHQKIIYDNSEFL
jgi:hypothetical protein